MPLAITESLGSTQRDIVVAEAVSPAYQAYQILHLAFVVAPVVAGLDKLTDWLTNWDAYLAPVISRILPISDHLFMMFIGAFEVAAGLLVAAKPRWGSLVVVAWLAGIIVNLLLGQNHYDVVLRDFGLLLGALALSRLSIDFNESTEVGGA